MPPCSPRRWPLAVFAALFCLAWPLACRAGKVEFSEYDLPNGLHVILAPEHSAPVIASYVLYHVGSKNERPDRTGFAHFFEHLMFEGTANIPRGGIDKLITRAGGNLNASTSYDRTDYQINLPANQLPLALWIESERMLHMNIQQVGVDTQRQVVKEERRLRYENQPYGSLFEEISKMVFAGTPYAWVPIGSVQYIDQATLDEFRAFYKTYYLPNNATLALAGDFDPATAEKLISDYFGPIPRGAEPPRPDVKIVPQTEPKSAEVLKQNTPLPATLHAWQAPTIAADDAYPVEMLTNILAGGRSSRLYLRLVDKEQAAVEARAFPFLQENAGMVGVFAVGNRGVTLARLDELIDEEIAAVQKDGVTDLDFQKARKQEESDFGRSHGTMVSLSHSLAQAHVFYGDTNHVNTELDRYLAVTKDDLKRVANQYFTKAGVSVLHFPPPAASPTPEAHP
jgi:predicted Zn-dependent peptidase